MQKINYCIVSRRTLLKISRSQKPYKAQTFQTVGFGKQLVRNAKQNNHALLKSLNTATIISSRWIQIPRTIFQFCFAEIFNLHLYIVCVILWVGFCNVGLIKCTLELGKPKGGLEIWEGGYRGQVRNKGS